MKKFSLFVVTLIFSAICLVCFTNSGIRKVDKNSRDEWPPSDWPKATELGDVPYSAKMYTADNINEILKNFNPDIKRIARFDIPLNYTTNTSWNAFELKATTNNFSHLTNEYTRLQFYAQSEVANTGLSYGQSLCDWLMDNGFATEENCEEITLQWLSDSESEIPMRVRNHTLDRMWIFICSGFSSSAAAIFNGDSRSYRYIGHTGVSKNSGGWNHRILTAVVLVDTEALERHRETEKEQWLKNNNEELIWCYHRMIYNNGDNPIREVEIVENQTVQQWRPIAPVCWYSEMPSWAKEQITNDWPRFPNQAAYQLIDNDNRLSD